MADEKSMLMQLCTENVYNDNIFHLLGLKTTATPREIRRRREDLESAHDMGEEAWKREFRHLLGNRPIPTFEEVQTAFEHLTDPEYRIVSEFFWMWPIEGDDSALKEFVGGQRSAAIRIWEQAALGFGKKRSIAQHNLAIVYQLYAIDAELQAIASDGEVHDDFHKQMCDYWEKSFGYWEELADNDAFWEIFATRMREFNDPRLTGDFVRHFRQQFPIAFDSINARLAAKYARLDRLDEAKRHVDYMFKTMSTLDDVDETIRILFRPTFIKLERLMEKYNQLVNMLPQKGLDAANELIDVTVDDYSMICGLLGGENPTGELHIAKAKLRRIQNDPKMCPSSSKIDIALNEVKQRESLLKIRESLYDPVVKACFNYLFKYSEATKDWDITIKWDEFLSKLAVADKLKATINKDLMSIFRVQVNDLINEYGKLVEGNAKRGGWAISQLISKSKPLIAAVRVRYGSDSDLLTEIKNHVVGACRSFLISYGNETRDWKGCFPLLKKIRELVTDSVIEKQLDADFKLLSENLRQVALKHQCWHCHCDNEKKGEIVFAMYGNVHHDSNLIMWDVRDIHIPLCLKCRLKYYGLHLLVLLVSIGLGIWCGIKSHGVKEGVGIAVSFFVGVGLATVIYRSRVIRWLWFRNHPAILEARREGFAFGKKLS